MFWKRKQQDVYKKITLYHIMNTKPVPHGFVSLTKPIDDRHFTEKTLIISTNDLRKLINKYNNKSDGFDDLLVSLYIIARDKEKEQEEEDRKASYAVSVDWLISKLEDVNS